MHDDENYRVGRGRPPKHSQFKKGRSGNPRGRPRKLREGLTPAQLRKDVLRIMNLPVTIKMPDGQTKTLTVREAHLYRLAQRAISSDKIGFSRDWQRIQREAVEENVRENPALLRIPLFDQLAREFPQEEAFIESLKALLKTSRGE
jgi:hypothetical protein